VESARWRAQERLGAMSVSIKILKKVGGRSDMIASRTWPQTKMTIGRGEECTLVLEDPKKHVSRVHAELEELIEGTYRLTVVSKVNPVFINGKRHAPGATLDLSAGDSFELGEYEIELLPPPSAPKVAAQVQDVEETTRPDNPMLKVPKPKPAAPEEATPAIAAAPVPPPPPPAIALVPPVPDPAVFEEETFIGNKMKIPDDEIFDITASPVSAEPAKEIDVFGEATYVGKTVPPVGANPLDEATYLGAKPPTGGFAGPVDGAGSQRAVKAFLEGLGLAREVSDAEAEVFMRHAGLILRAAIEGAMALLAARATAKKELRAEDRTMVASKDNNPLKLMSDPQEALAFLFDTKDRTGGFLDPARAVGDAFEDLRAHEVALFAAMRAALLGTVQRFDPKTLEVELEKGAGSLGLNRKAKLWELFAAYQSKLARDAEDDFNKVFGREFMGTYMAQVKRLRGGR